MQPLTHYHNKHSCLHPPPPFIFSHAFSTVAVTAFEQGNKVLKALRRAFRVTTCLYVCQQCRERNSITQSGGIGAMIVCVMVDGRGIQIAWRYQFTLQSVISTE